MCVRRICKADEHRRGGFSHAIRRQHDAQHSAEHGDAEELAAISGMIILATQRDAEDAREQIQRRPRASAGQQQRDRRRNQRMIASITNFFGMRSASHPISRRPAMLHANTSEMTRHLL